MLPERGTRQKSMAFSLVLPVAIPSRMETKTFSSDKTKAYFFAITHIVIRIYKTRYTIQHEMK